MKTGVIVTDSTEARNILMIYVEAEDKFYFLRQDLFPLAFWTVPKGWEMTFDAIDDGTIIEVHGFGPVELNL